ncbi:putative ankyrin repeat protein RF_0381 [Onthophagus taurus]|uniref:putative ankyrin repeat protein RF_0381 n=1 Tax=Onthophagus taurus TaxID=166361 RepID=UPI000C20DA64|nr:uncharacterized protein LOC111420047 [Onthophagus taurus]
MEYGTDLLIKAIKIKDTNEIKLRLAQGAKINERCGLGTTPLIAAVETGDLTIVKLLIENSSSRLHERDASPHNNIGYFVVNGDCDTDLDDVLTPEGMEALEWDSELGNSGNNSPPSSPESEGSLYRWYARILSKTSEVLHFGEYDMTRLDWKGWNALHYAVKQGYLDITQYLLETCPEVSVNDSDSETFTPLHLATKYNRPQLVKYLLSKGANVNAFTERKETPLHIASKLGSVEIVRFLLKNRADVNVFDIEEQSALHKAVINRHDEVAKMLICAGTKLNHEDVYRKTVMLYVILNDMMDVARDLVDYGAKIMQSQFLLHLVITKGDFEAVKILHRGGAVLTVRDDGGNTPLMRACSNQQFSIAKYLLENGVSANATNPINGQTALHNCIQAIKSPDLFKQFLDLLVNYDVNLNSPSHYGNPFFYSLDLQNICAACILVKYGINVNLLDDKSGLNTLYLAKKKGSFELVKLIILAGFDLKRIKDLKKFNDKDDKNDNIFEFIVNTMSKPLFLRDLCRIRIRRWLGKRLMVTVERLPLPVYLQRFLTLDIL